MARTGLTRMDVKRARDALLAQGQHTSIDAIRIALGNTGSKTTIHRYLKELEEDEGASLTRAGSLSDAIQDPVARLAARLHEEAQALVDQQAAAAAAQRSASRRSPKSQGSALSWPRCGSNSPAPPPPFARSRRRTPGLVWRCISATWTSSGSPNR
ncbi:DNA-binding protein [Paraburkholderia mimosarum]|uniref:DNA-binding protein n=1 Tax=Paraburkholderia mimosarum TaxID=312026 RepID=UPI000A41078C|nr:DNA-binding protein [Paraburkholderia mimosarum]